MGGLNCIALHGFVVVCTFLDWPAYTTCKAGKEGRKERKKERSVCFFYAHCVTIITCWRLKVVSSFYLGWGGGHVIGVKENKTVGLIFMV